MKLIAKPDEAAKLSAVLRKFAEPSLRRRRAVVSLSALSIGCMALITSYQTGVISHLPEPPLPKMDADKVDASADAYAILSTPDAALGVVSYAATLVLAAMAGSDRAMEVPLIPLALAAKATADAAAQLTVDQVKRQKAFCFWCLTSAAASFAILPLVFPEARTAWNTLRRRG